MMKHTDVFTDFQLFPIEKSRYLDKDDAGFVLYSPLAHDFIEVDDIQLNELRRQLKDNGCFQDANLQQRLLDLRKTPETNHVTTPDKAYAMTVLPNNICNFSCSYCYAAKGRGKEELSIDTLKTVLDFFVDPQRISRRDLYITFGGGGEPMISWDKVKFCVEYADHLAQKYGFTIVYSYVTNGSIVSDDILATVKKHNIKVSVSFDILQDIQNRQRGNYQKVCDTLNVYLAHGITPSVNAVITPVNADRQREMVEELHRKFPKIKKISFDFVVDGDLFDKPEQLEDFMTKYILGFYDAQSLSDSYGMRLTSLKYQNLQKLKTRACAGGFDLTPLGTLSLCFMVSSPAERQYNELIYGKVEDGKVTFNRDKFKTLIERSLSERDRCDDCFIRWHCGGGCLYNMLTYSKEQMEVMCEADRRFSLIGIMERKKRPL